MVRLTNPQGITKEMTDEEYTQLLWKFTESQSFQEWVNKYNLVGSYTHYGKKILNKMVLQFFFDKNGYKVEKNVQLKGEKLK